MRAGPYTIYYVSGFQRGPRGQPRQGICAEPGFTLVELLIALVLIAIITVLMFSGLRLGSRAWEGVETVSERVADLRVAHNFFDRTLRQTQQHSLVFDGTMVPVFAGDAESLELVAPLSEHVGIPTCSDSGATSSRLSASPANTGTIVPSNTRLCCCVWRRVRSKKLCATRRSATRSETVSTPSQAREPSRKPENISTVMIAISTNAISNSTSVKPGSAQMPCRGCPRGPR